MKINLTKFKEYLISWHYWQVNLIVFSIKYNNNDHEKLWNVNSAVEIVYDVLKNVNHGFIQHTGIQVISECY